MSKKGQEQLRASVAAKHSVDIISEVLDRIDDGLHVHEIDSKQEITFSYQLCVALEELTELLRVQRVVRAHDALFLAALRVSEAGLVGLTFDHEKLGFTVELTLSPKKEAPAPTPPPTKRKKAVGR